MISVAMQSFAATPSDDGRANVESLGGVDLLKSPAAWATIDLAYTALLRHTDGGTLPLAKPIYLAFI